MAVPETPQAGSREKDAYEIRITPGGKIQGWVANALEFLEKNKNKPLVLHTLPGKQNKTPEMDGQNVRDTTTRTTETRKQGLSPSTSAVPRLISVVEIIKREFIKLDGSPEDRTLHQYNQIGCLEQTDTVIDETGDEARRDALLKALEGKNQ
ncbi:hypothetical protein OE88DRAFT_1665371 [Heliocybe sulcata]|uniref:Uncharacterized protein n=1 Tax=Heliocybe sulcata TaxID=5364 RepID=A0A5C3MSL3_9AGAM|nr:hypothetical protein OE88DRAFT_1665371 [Heliocybe sulcata]